MIQKFLQLYKEAFGDAAPLPIAFGYSHTAATEVHKVPHCMIGAIHKVCNGGSLTLTVDNVLCGGGSLYTRFAPMQERIPLFVSETEHYKQTPEQVKGYIANLNISLTEKPYLNFIRMNQLSTLDEIEGILFFATPDILSGLCSWAFYDNNADDAVCTKFASGCYSIITFAVQENQKQGDFTGRPINEINLYSSEMASALCSIDRVSASANMTNRLSEAIVEAYKDTDGAPITFAKMLEEYQAKMIDSSKDDTISSVLKQLVRANIFDEEDKADLIGDCYIIKMDGYPKDGPIAKAIVYFLISKLNNIYEQLDKQATNDEVVQIRHFSIIDEAHYMLDFDNRPLRNLIAVGRNKGLSIILATQNMSSFKSKGFDFYANAQYPLIMKQQTIDDKVIKDLFGVSGNELQEIRTAIAGLQKGELIIKDQMAFALGMGKKYKKINVTHLI